MHAMPAFRLSADTITTAKDTVQAEPDSTTFRNDGWDLQYEEDLKYLQEEEPVDTSKTGKMTDSILVNLQKVMARPPRSVDPIRAMWLAMVFPGAGQMYNGKFWKLPIIYGGYLGCVYALNWNSQMLKDYSQAYLDIMDDDPNTKSYEKMLPMGYSIEGKEERFKEIFKNKKNYYRKYRDMSILAFAGVYLISVIDAYVDAELSCFDISRDLSLHWEPSTLNRGSKLERRYAPTSLGLQCNLTF